MPLWQVRYISY